MEKYEVVSCPTTELSYTNKAVLNPQDPFSQFEHIAIRYPKRNDAFVFSVIRDPLIERGKIAFNLTGRKWASLQTNSIIEAAPYKFIPESQCLNTITFTVDFTNRSNLSSIEFDTEEMSKQFSLQFSNQAFTLGQLFGFAFELNHKKVIFELKVKEMQAINIQDTDPKTKLEIGLSTANTVVMFEPADGSQVRLTGGKRGSVAAPRIFAQNWNFEDMGIGGLSEQFNTIFRRAFNSRLLPPHFAQKAKREHVKGILLYGPPGTGKTLVARQIAKMLLAREPKIVNGPEVLNKFVGESEANIRKLFAEAEEEQAKMGINSGLHVIIFDEIDSICKARGSSASSTGANDGVVNQLLTKIDGVDALQNVLLIGMTNRKDLIDEALLRPGRLEVQIEIGLPNKQGRLEILKIHTSGLRQENLLDPSVNLEELAECAKNYTGAELAGLVKAAQSLATNRIIAPGKDLKINEEMLDAFKVTREDFMYAMKYDVKPALGASEDLIEQLAKPIIEWDPEIRSIRSELSGIIEQLPNSAAEDNRPYFVLLYGQPGSGLTTIAVNMAKETNFPFIRVSTPRAFAGKTDSFKVQYLEKLYDDAARSELSCIVIDRLDLLLDYSKFGPTYAKACLASLLAGNSITLTEGRRMLVICTCSQERCLKDLELYNEFSETVQIPSLTNSEQVGIVLNHFIETGDPTFTPNQCNELVESLRLIPFRLGISKIERLIRIAKRDSPSKRVSKFKERMMLLCSA